MKKQLQPTGISNQLTLYFVIIFAISISLFLLGSLAEDWLPELSIALNFSSLMVVAPISAALICIYKEKGISGVKNLLKKTHDFRKITRKIWYLPILFLMPAITLIDYWIMNRTKSTIPDQQIPLPTFLMFFLLFFVAAIGEEVGWQGFAYERLEKRYNALTSGLLLGIISAGWHLIPLIQLHNPPSWIFWQSINIFLTRIIVVWIFNNAGKSVFAAILYHTIYNLCTMLIPNYDPMIAGLTLMVFVIAIISMWGANTLSEFRYPRLGITSETGNTA
jgi:membrane protease YdiL (CAAX protease family)